MLVRLVFRLIGARLGRSGALPGGRGGAMLAAIAFPLIRRLGPPAWLLLGAGVLVARRLRKHRSR